MFVPCWLRISLVITHGFCVYLALLVARSHVRLCQVVARMAVFIAHGYLWGKKRVLYRKNALQRLVFSERVQSIAHFGSFNAQPTYMYTGLYRSLSLESEHPARMRKPKNRAYCFQFRNAPKTHRFEVTHSERAAPGGATTTGADATAPKYLPKLGGGGGGGGQLGRGRGSAGGWGGGGGNGSLAGGGGGCARPTTTKCIPQGV